MTISDLISYIRSEAHDNSLSNSTVYGFIDKAIRTMEDLGEYDYQTVNKEKVTLASGASTIPLTYNLKRINKILDSNSLELTNSYYYISNSNVITLNTATTSATYYYVYYVRYSPTFDGTDDNFIIPANMHRALGVGAAFYALLYNNQPEAGRKYNEFFTMLQGLIHDKAFKTKFSYKTTNVKGI